MRTGLARVETRLLAVAGLRRLPRGGRVFLRFARVIFPGRHVLIAVEGVPLDVAVGQERLLDDFFVIHGSFLPCEMLSYPVPVPVAPAAVRGSGSSFAISTSRSRTGLIAAACARATSSSLDTW